MSRSWATRGSATLVLALVLAAGACSDGASKEETSAVGASAETVAAAGEQAATTAPPVDASPTSSPSASGSSTVAPVGSTTRPPATSGATTTSLGGPGLPPSTPPSQPVVTSGGGAVASGLTALPGCEAGRALVRLSWRPGGGSEQVVAVSARKDGLDTGNYTTSEVLAPSAATYSLRDSQPGGIYYWRVLNRRDGGWAASATAQFEGPTCVPF